MRQFWIGCILLSTAIGSQAAALGRHSGAAVIGRPLDVRVQAILGADEDVSSLCPQVDVFYGDNQVSPSSVRVVAQKAAPDAEASLRVQASVPVDEPIVTLYVRAGCNAPFSRRYVLLADLLTEPQSAALPSKAPQAPGTALPTRALPSANVVAAEPVSRPDTGPSSAGGSVGTGATGGKQTPPSANAEAQTVAPKARASVSRPVRPAPSVVRRAVEPAGPRLELDPVDLNLSLDRDPVLKLSVSMLSEPTASEQERAAAASLWKAINASAEDILRDSQKLTVLEAEAKGLREQEAVNKAALQEMEGRLTQTRYLTWLVYGLAALLLLAALGLWHFWRRRGTSLDGDSATRAWWAAAAAEKEMEKEGIPMPSGKAGAQALDLDLNLGFGRHSAQDSLNSLHDSELGVESSPAVLLSADKRDFAGSHAPGSRSVATEELFDVQQQADFFVSLGESEQAIQVLKNHLAESQEPSALAYLDLFKLYHKLNRKADYEQLRGEFNRQFNAGAPPFHQYSDESLGLEAYETAFGRIQALWPQPRVLDVIEQSIFREPGDAESEMFDLEAYRELLLLHAIAKDMIKRDAIESRPPADFQHTAIKPLKAVGNKALVAAAVASSVPSQDSPSAQPTEVIPHASPRLGLDVDLDELSEISAFEASLPEIVAPVEPSAKPKPRPGSGADDDMGNLIDFEMLDFLPPEDGNAEDTGKPGIKKK